VAEVLFVGRESQLAIDGLHQLLDTTSSAKIQGASLFSLAKLLETKPATREKALSYYRRIVADYADVKGPRGATLGEKAAASLFEVEHLQVGMPVPDIAAVDETNAPFKLSDYKGKVVLVDFWGFW
jgi:hypothetical protein